jgi:uncharacterized protein (UPF0303 family)
MAQLTAKARKNIPSSEFALPGGRFPIENKAHAEAALSGATRAENAGNITPAQAATVRHKAEHVLGEKDSTYHNK